MSLKVDLTGTRTLQAQILELQKIFPEEVKAMILEVALVDIETYAKTKVNIPVDTGRLRASIHTKYVKKPEPENKRTKAKMIEAQSEIGHSIQQSQTTYNYKDNEGNEFDGTLTEKADEFTVIVGTNVKYAKKINRTGGGGPNSNRSLNSKRNLGKYGKRQGPSLPKGWGMAFFDKAVANGKMALRNEMKNLANRLKDIAKDAAKNAGKKG
jgi:phage gpG-like protein